MFLAKTWNIYAVIIGILKQSQKRTNLAAFLEESISKQPARTIG
jgi:hypothetical protein